MNMIRLRGVINRFSVPIFFLIAYGWSWGCWFSISRIIDFYQDVLQGKESFLLEIAVPIHIRIGFAILALAGTFGPAISAVILTVALSGKAGLREFFSRIVKWRVDIRYYLAVFLIPPVMVIIQFVVFTLLGGEPQTHIANYSFLPVLGMFADFFFRAGGQEELGFRGFAVPKLQEKFSPGVTSLIIGVLWFGWHLPLELWLPSIESVQSYEETLMFGLFVIALSFIYTWIYNRTQSILMPMLLHATYNTVQTFLSTGFSHPHPNGWLIAWLALIVPYAVLGVWLVWRDGLGNNTEPPQHRQGGSEIN